MFHSYLTVDYERGNFSVSQCLWDNVPTQIRAILSPSYDNISTSTPSSFPTPIASPTHVHAGVIPGAVVAGVVLAAACILTYYLCRRRNQRVSTASTEDIDLASFNKQGEDKKSFLAAPGSPFPADRKPGVAPSLYSQYRPDGELGTQGEIYQLATHDNLDGDYATAAMQIASDRRAANTPEMANTGVMCELPGSEPVPVELDDFRSRESLLPATRSRAQNSRVSSRTPSPLSACLPA
jgi:hypothetical protein